MCYSGRCSFEGYIGICRVKDYVEIMNLTGRSACYIGGGECSCREEEEMWQTDYDKGNISKWKKAIRENKLIL